MNWKQKKKPLIGLVGGTGFVALMGGFVGGLYSGGMAIFLAMAIWIIGTMLIHVLID